MDAASPGLDALYRGFRARVYRWAFALCRSDADAVDSVQEVFLRLLRSGTTFASDSAAAAWLRRTTARVAIDRWRATRARRELPRKAAAATDEGARRAPGGDPLEADESRERMRGAIAGLSEQQQLVLLAKTFDQRSFAEIGRELGLATPTVKTHYFRALGALRARLTPTGDSQ